MGAEKYEFSAVLDRHTSDICHAHDGHKYKLSEAVPGTNYPPMHPFCRCKVTTPQQTEEDIQADIDRMLNGRSIDDIERELDRLIEEKEALPESDSTLNSAEENPQKMLTVGDNGDIIKSVENYFSEAGFRGEPHIPPESIDTDSLSFSDKHIKDERHHNVSEKEAKSFINNADISVSRVLSNGSKSENYYSQEGAAYVNKVKNLITTAFRAEEYDDKTQHLIDLFNNEGDDDNGEQS